MLFCYLLFSFSHLLTWAGSHCRSGKLLQVGELVVQIMILGVPGALLTSGDSVTSLQIAGMMSMQIDAGLASENFQVLSSATGISDVASGNT